MSSKLAVRVEKIVSRETSNLGSMIVTRQFERMGINGDEFGPEHLQEFVGLIKDVLVLFVGEEHAVKIVSKIEKDCSEDPGACIKELTS